MTAPLVPGPLVTAPEPARRRYGLFDAANGPLDLPDHGEGGGIRYVPDTCGQAYAYGVTCYNGENPAPGKPLDTDNPEVSTGIFAVLATLNCSAVGYTQADDIAKVQRRLQGAEMAAVERAFWTGQDFQGNDLGILNLDGAAEDIDPGYDPGLITDVIGALERYAYTEQGYGYQAVIHAPVEVASFAFESGALILMDGNRKVTPMGSIWDFGAYPSGSVIITGQTTVWRNPAVDTYSAFHNESNLNLVVAERAYAVAFDCFAGRAEYNPLEVS